MACEPLTHRPAQAMLRKIHFYVKEALAAADADGMARELFGVIAFQRQNLPEAFDDVGLEHRTVV